MRAARIGLSLALALFAASFGARAVAFQAASVPIPPPPIPPADVSGCQACHGANGISPSMRTPNLAGQQRDYLALQLRAFRAGTRKNDLMESVAATLSDIQIAQLAEYWSARPAMPPADAHTAAGPAIPSRMAFPADFPAGFTLYQSATAEGSVAERYANRVAIEAARAGRPLPDGSVILVVNRPAPAAGATTPGAPRGYAAMESRAGWGGAIPALIRNGNWDYAVFDAARVRNEGLNQAQCLACHRPQSAGSYVFTIAELRERAAHPAG